MHVNIAYFAPSTIRFPYELKKTFGRILHELQTLIKCIHVILHWMRTSWIGYSSIERVVATPYRYQCRTRVYV